jgi:peptide/nickel transport system substrate-binding protein
VEFLQALFEAAGVKATAQISDWPSFSTNYVQQGKHQIALLGWLNIVDPDRLMFAQFSTGGPTNWGGYSNPEVDKLLQEGRSTLDQAGRITAYQKATSSRPRVISCSTPRTSRSKCRQRRAATSAA